jgi:queuine tRNA-ribosyltransferase
MYAVIHGGIDADLRKESCEFLTSLPFDGFAIGGSVGKTKEEMMDMLTTTLPRLPVEKPNHLLGIGDLVSLKRCIPLGIDTFDSSYPTRAARHGLILTQEGGIKVEKADHANYFAPIDPACSCWTCKNFTLAYLHHLFKSKELTAYALATIHNLHFMVDLMHRVRQQILDDSI